MSTEINHSEMVAMLAKSGEDIRVSLTAEKCHLLHMAVGIAGETFEFMNAAYKEDYDNCVEELGDIEFYYEGMIQQMPKGSVNIEALPIGEMSDADLMSNFFDAAGEVLDQTKKYVIYENDEKLPKVGEALATFRNCLDGVYAVSDVSKEQTVEGNIKKLGKRYEGFKYSNEAAATRADKEEGE